MYGIWAGVGQRHNKEVVDVLFSFDMNLKMNNNLYYVWYLGWRWPATQ